MTSAPADATRTALLAKMAASRSALLEARNAAMLTDARRKSSFSPANLSALAASAPHVTLLAAILAGALILGPRRIAAVVVRNGLTAWIARTVRRLAGR
ncbi:hypothetical protein [Paraburkholderia rhizosphaerae]|uniref:YqjK-like protein n=1 Tax=Paraburkholderia rhizosphaerae TaxID=480658 RepID=A0A4R8LJA2_9BURK|nr:hypothetical protein [Paraburkholderia rhizosphaerae]TDY43871.1 hypothetical protein BX592_11773 [Paraburkholderia rhizosphaerae]